MTEGRQRVRLISMKDEPQMPPGIEGTIEYVDDADSIHVRWDNGSSLALLPSIDEWEYI